MAHAAPTQAIRPDIDIDAAIQRSLMSYPPLSHDRHRVHVTVQDGHVTVRGHVKTPQTLRYLINLLPRIEGVQSVDHADFHDDETIRLDTARTMLMGVLVNVEYGAVILAGRLPDGMSVPEVVNLVAQVRGVHRVVTAF